MPFVTTRAMYAETVCPHCGAGKGEPCREPSGRVRHPMHHKRRGAFWLARHAGADAVRIDGSVDKSTPPS